MALAARLPLVASALALSVGCRGKPDRVDDKPPAPPPPFSLFSFVDVCSGKAEARAAAYEDAKPIARHLASDFVFHVSLRFVGEKTTG